MRDLLYRAGFPGTVPGWLAFLAAAGLGVAATAVASGIETYLLAGLILLTWLLNLATIRWDPQWRVACHVAAWVLLYRVVVPERPWYLVVPASLLLAGAIIWEQERRVAEA